MDEVKEAFLRVKEDILNIAKEFYTLKLEIIELKKQIENTNKLIEKIELEGLELKRPELENPTQETILAPKEQIQSTQQLTEPLTEQTQENQELLTKLRQIADEVPTHPTHIPTDNLPLQAPESQYFDFSIGNEGVPTDRQTDRQTDIPTHFQAENFTQDTIDSTLELLKKNSKSENNSDFKKAEEILSSLDSLKKEIRLKFKRLTEQEMLVFSTIYLLEEENLQPDYKQTAEKLNLTESSIRDYVLKLINKGIPILKNKQKNKKILLKISPELKKITPLSSIITLREL